jgi:hypothetical protein
MDLQIEESLTEGEHPEESTPIAIPKHKTQKFLIISKLPFSPRQLAFKP